MRRPARSHVIARRSTVFDLLDTATTHASVSVLAPHVPLPSAAAFAALVFAILLLWAPRTTNAPWARHAWTMPAVLALALALSGGLLAPQGLLALLAFAAACILAARAAGRAASVAAHAAMLALAAGLFLHVVPGFDNPRIVAGAVLGPGSEPYTKYLNFDKGMAGLLLLGLYAPDRSARDEGLRHVPAFAWRFLVLVAATMALALAAGYVRWDVKLPGWWPAWIWSMVFLTALPEEALFRGIVQTSLERWLGHAAAAIGLSAVLFGVAHLAGGPVYVVLATVAGLGYGWIYASTRSIGSAVAAHAGLNAVHFFLFSYPSLALSP